MVAATRATAANRTCDPYASPEHVVESQGLTAIAAPAADLSGTRHYGYGEAHVACHASHVRAAGSQALGLHAY